MKLTYMIPGVVVANLLLLPLAVPAQSVTTTPPKPVAMAMAMPGAFTALLTSPMGSRAASGIATLTGTTVTVSWRDDTPGSRRMWSVRRGTCAQDDGPLGANEARGNLSVDGTGRGTGSASLTVLPNAEHPLHVVVHDVAAAEASTAAGPAEAEILACGVLWDGTQHSRPVRRAATAATEHGHPAPTAAASMPAMDHAAMGHAAMKAPADEVKASGTDAMGEATHDMHATHNRPAVSMPALRDSSAVHLRKIYRMMLADPVIRERVAADSGLRQLVSKTLASPAKPASRNKPAPAKAAPAPKPGMDPSMDHSKMKGMKKPPA